MTPDQMLAASQEHHTPEMRVPVLIASARHAAQGDAAGAGLFVSASNCSS